MPSLSGGEAARAGLAALLLARFDVFLLDEPTNDLDLDGLARLERFVSGLAAGCVIVSHDRTFLQRTITHVVELDEFTHAATRYAGGWDAYLRERDVARQQAQQAYEEYDGEALVPRRSGAARTRVGHAGPVAGEEEARRQRQEHQGVQDQPDRAVGRQGGAHREDDGAPRRRGGAPRGAGSCGSPSRRRRAAATWWPGSTTRWCSSGTFTLGPVDLQIDYGERVVIEGPNGSGKSTLLQALLGEVALTSGVHWRGPGVVVGRLEQAREQLQDADTVLEAFMAATGMLVPEARTLLAKFGIGAEHVHRPAESLSPGERTRLVLALLMAKGSNCLVLDEPTNHLDLPGDRAARAGARPRSRARCCW